MSSAIDHINSIERLVYNQLFTATSTEFYYDFNSNASSSGLSAQASFQRPGWNQTSPWSMKYDTDNDGIPDALDNYNGPGAWSPFN